MQTESGPPRPTEEGHEVERVQCVPVPGEGTRATPPRRRSRRRRVLILLAGVILAYLVVAYLLMPAAWGRYTRRHPSLEDIPGITQVS